MRVGIGRDGIIGIGTVNRVGYLIVRVRAGACAMRN